MRLILKILNICVTTILILFIVAAISLVVSARFSNDGAPTVKGHKLLTVLSGSMEPKIHTGDAIIIKSLTEDKKIKEGDIITFHTKEKEDMLITHRVVGVVSVNGKPSAYVTKGDANDSKDMSTVKREQITGTYAWRIPCFGYVSNFFHKPIGIILCVILPALAIIGHEFYKIYQALSEEEKAKKEVEAQGPER
ncbi:MAG: signal peptidase I [Clostridiales bacterium]|nr:signal peptidase I [Clostridiales bacterium]MCF8022572.1 signal peptidase I [Clostridiales bacterium]